MDNTLVSQKCTKCDEEKPITEFHKHRNHKSGYASCCRLCCAVHYREHRHKYRKAYYQANKERAITTQKVWVEANKEKFSAYQKVWREENREHHDACKKAWKEENRERFNAKRSEWKKENPELVRKYDTDRRVRIIGSDGDHTVADIKNLLVLQKNKCAICKTSISKGYHVDHIIALSKGGSNDKYNLQLLCAPCNLSKNAKDPIDFMQKVGFLL